MLIRDWRLQTGKTQAECADALGIQGGARSFQRIENGANKVDADMVERIVAMTGGAVTVSDMHSVRLHWLGENQPERLALVALFSALRVGSAAPVAARPQIAEAAE